MIGLEQLLNLNNNTYNNKVRQDKPLQAFKYMSAQSHV